MKKQLLNIAENMAMAYNTYSIEKDDFLPGIKQIIVKRRDLNDSDVEIIAKDHIISLVKDRLTIVLPLGVDDLDSSSIYKLLADIEVAILSHTKLIVDEIKATRIAKLEKQKELIEEELASLK